MIFVPALRSGAAVCTWIIYYYYLLFIIIIIHYLLIIIIYDHSYNIEIWGCRVHLFRLDDDEPVYEVGVHGPAILNVTSCHGPCHE